MNPATHIKITIDVRTCVILSQVYKHGSISYAFEISSFKTFIFIWKNYSNLIVIGIHDPFKDWIMKYLIVKRIRWDDETKSLAVSVNI